MAMRPQQSSDLVDEGEVRCIDEVGTQVMADPLQGKVPVDLIHHRRVHAARLTGLDFSHRCPLLPGHVRMGSHRGDDKEEMRFSWRIEGAISGTCTIPGGKVVWLRPLEKK